MQKNIDLIKAQQKIAKEVIENKLKDLESKGFNAKEFIEKINADNTPGMEFKVIASNMAIDRDNEIIDINGWDTENFMKNPVILWGHDLKSLPIGVALKCYREGDNLIVEGKFASKEANPIAENVRCLYNEKIIKTVSVGFIGKEYTFIKTKDGQDILKWTKQELYELSFVPVPSNPEAVSLMKSKGLSDESINSVVEKGEVLDEVVAEDMYEAKQEMFDDVSEVFYAFSCLYFDPETPVEDFNKLLTEVIDLLTRINKGEDIDNDDAQEGADATDMGKSLLGKKSYAKIIQTTNFTSKKLKSIMETLEDLAFDVKALKSNNEEKATSKNDNADEKKAFNLSKFMSKETLQELNKLTNLSLSELNQKK